MAAFTDQLSRLGSLNVLLEAPGDLWLRRILYQALEVLPNTSSKVLNAIGLEAERMLSRRGHSSVTRTLIGDINLIESDGGIQIMLNTLAEQDLVTDEATVYAGFALWKIVDYVDERAGRLPSIGFQWVSTSIEEKSFAVVQRSKRQEQYLGEATYASTKAWQLREKSLSHAQQQGLTRLINEGISQREMVQKALKARHASLPQHKALALRMANEGAFASRAVAARRIADNIEKGTKDGEATFYTPETIEKWLKEADWKPAKKR